MNTNKEKKKLHFVLVECALKNSPALKTDPQLSIEAGKPPDDRVDSLINGRILNWRRDSR